MQRKNTKTSATDHADHFGAISQLLDQLRKHLTSTAGGKGSYTDYLRLLEFYNQTQATQPRNIIVRWVDHEMLENPEPQVEPRP